MLKKTTILMAMACLLFIIGCEKENSFPGTNESTTNQNIDLKFLEDFLSEDYVLENNPYIKIRESGDFRSENDLIDMAKEKLFDKPEKARKFEEDYGYPVWAKIKYTNDGSVEVASIPIARLTEDHLNGFLHVTKDDLNKPGKLNYRIATLDDKIKKKHTGSMFNLLDMLAINGAEDELFGEGNCEIIPVINEEIYKIHGKRLAGETTRDEYCVVTYGYYQDCTTYGGTYEVCGPVYTEVISVSCYHSGGGGTTDSDQPPCELCPNSGGTSSGDSDSILDDFADDVFMLDDDDEPLNECEKLLIIQHPICAVKIKNNKDLAFSKSQEFFGSVNAKNNCIDAFRHAYFNALNSKDCGISIAQEFGDAHEDCSDTPIEEQVMDLYNNSVGYNIYNDNPTATDEQLADLVHFAMTTGLLKQLDSSGNLINCP